MLLIEFRKPAGATHADIRQFIIDALESMGGCRRPDDPMFHSLHDVRVSKPIFPWKEPQ